MRGTAAAASAAGAGISWITTAFAFLCVAVQPWPAPGATSSRRFGLVSLLSGDGVGPAVWAAAVRVLEATGVQFDWDVQQAGEAAIKEFGTPLPEPLLASIRKHRVALKGPVTTPVGSGFRSVNVALRQELDLYALVRPVKAYKGARNLRDDLDFVIVREDTEHIYARIAFEQGPADATHLLEEISTLAKKTIRPDSRLSIKPISITGSERIVQFAFDYARQNKRRKVTPSP